MKFLKISNIKSSSSYGQMDYKGLNISNFETPLYPDDHTFCYVRTSEETVPVNADILEITELEYLQFKSELESRPEAIDPVDARLKLVESALEDIILNGGILNG